MYAAFRKPGILFLTGTTVSRIQSCWADPFVKV